MANEAQARGSEKLLAQLAKKGAAATLEEVKAAVSLPATSEIDVVKCLSTLCVADGRQIGQKVKSAEIRKKRDFSTLICTSAPAGCD